MRWLVRTLALLALLAVAGAAAGAWWAWDRLQEPYLDAQEPVRFEIPSGRSATAILTDLEAAGVLRDARLTRIYLIYGLDDPPLHAGEYRFEEPLSAPDVLDHLVRGEVVTWPVTLIEGLTLEETAAAIAAAGFGDEEVLLREMARGERIHQLDPEARTLEGYLYPDTYHFARGTTEVEIVDTLVDTFVRRFRREVEPLLVGDSRTVREIVILASIVEKEARLEEERDIIASVYANRLRIGMALQADPTVIYAMKQLGTWDGNIRRRDLKLDSPYNTYVYPGLPPGPICSPRMANLAATARPADTPYFYFVSRNDGSHVFSRNYAEHRRNVDVWQKQYWRRKWAEEKKDKG
jgi:UPF0755 protein